VGGFLGKFLKRFYNIFPKAGKIIQKLLAKAEKYGILK